MYKRQRENEIVRGMIKRYWERGRERERGEGEGEREGGGGEGEREKESNNCLLVRYAVG